MGIFKAYEEKIQAQNRKIAEIQLDNDKLSAKNQKAINMINDFNWETDNCYTLIREVKNALVGQN